MPPTAGLGWHPFAVKTKDMARFALTENTGQHLKLHGCWQTGQSLRAWLFVIDAITLVAAIPRICLLGRRKTTTQTALPRGGRPKVREMRPQNCKSLTFGLSAECAPV